MVETRKLTRKPSNHESASHVPSNTILSWFPFSWINSWLAFPWLFLTKTTLQNKIMLRSRCCASNHLLVAYKAQYGWFHSINNPYNILQHLLGRPIAAMAQCKKNHGQTWRNHHTPSTNIMFLLIMTSLVTSMAHTSHPSPSWVPQTSAGLVKPPAVWRSTVGPAWHWGWSWFLMVFVSLCLSSVGRCSCFLFL